MVKPVVIMWFIAQSCEPSTCNFMASDFPKVTCSPMNLNTHVMYPVGVVA